MLTSIHEWEKYCDNLSLFFISVENKSKLKTLREQVEANEDQKHLLDQVMSVMDIKVQNKSMDKIMCNLSKDRFLVYFRFILYQLISCSKIIFA